VAAHKLVVVENFVKAVDTAELALVDRLAVPAVDMQYMVAALFVSERSWRDCYCQHSQAFHSLDRNSCY
jgi:hypothetical protein